MALQHDRLIGELVDRVVCLPFRITAARTQPGLFLLPCDRRVTISGQPQRIFRADYSPAGEDSPGDSTGAAVIKF